MHNHVDRDKFVEIHWDNIEEDAKPNFEKVDPRIFANFGTSYDLNSVMHYAANAFAIDRYKDTMTPINRKLRGVIGQRRGLSPGDVKRINNMYNCFK